jgi:cobalt-zinc-cadmium efflux system protein
MCEGEALFALASAEKDEDRARRYPWSDRAGTGQPGHRAGARSSGSHDHAPRPATAAGRHGVRLIVTLALTTTFLAVEAAVGFWTGSLALLADAGHMLTDAAALGLALFAIWVSARPATPEKTYGYYRVEIFAALVNAVVLLLISAGILYEAYRRFLDPPEVLGGPMLVVAVLGLAVNVAGMWLLRAAAAESLNLRGAYLEVLSDALGSLGVLIAALVIITTGWRFADPLVAAAIGLFILPRTLSLLRQAINILLEGTPPHVNIDEVTTGMREVAGVREVHDLHAWTLTSGKHAMSAHVVVEDLAAGNRLLDRLHALLHGRFGIDHTTIQLESPPLLRIERAGDDRLRNDGRPPSEHEHWPQRNS